MDLFSQPDLTIPFNKGRDNNIALQENRLHFSRQAMIVIEELIKGEAVSSRKMMREPYNILDLRARIWAIERILVITIPERKILGGKGSKEWYPTPELIELLKSKIGQVK